MEILQNKTFKGLERRASNLRSLISTKIFSASAAVSSASCRFFRPLLSWLILGPGLHFKAMKITANPS